MAEPKDFNVNGLIEAGNDETVSIEAVRRTLLEEVEKKKDPLELKDSDKQAEENTRSESDQLDKIGAKQKEEGEKEKIEEEESKEEEKDAEEESKEEQKADAEDKPLETEEKDKDGEEKVLESPGEAKFKEKEIAFGLGEEEFKVPNNAVVEILVDGGVKKVFLQEALNRASGDLSVQDRINKVQAIKAEYAREQSKRDVEWSKRQDLINDVNTKVKTISELATEGRPETLLVQCARWSKKNPTEVVKKFIEDSVAWGEKFAQMTQGERDSWLSNLQVEVDRQQLEEDKQEVEKSKTKIEIEKENRDLDAYLKSEMGKNGVSEVQLIAMRDKLLEAKIELKGETPLEKVDEIFDYIHEQKIYTAVENLDPKLMKDRELLKAIYDYTDVRDVRDPNTIEAIVRGFSEKESKSEEERIAENLSRKAQKSGAISKKAKEADESDFGPMTLNAFVEKHHGL